MWTTRRLLDDCKEKGTFWTAEIKSCKSSLVSVRAACYAAVPCPSPLGLTPRHPRLLPSQVKISLNMTAQRVNLGNSATHQAAYAELQARYNAVNAKMAELQTRLAEEVTLRLDTTRASAHLPS